MSACGSASGGRSRPVPRTSRAAVGRSVAAGPGSPMARLQGRTQADSNGSSANWACRSLAAAFQSLRSRRCKIWAIHELARPRRSQPTELTEPPHRLRITRPPRADLHRNVRTITFSQLTAHLTERRFAHCQQRSHVCPAQRLSVDHTWQNRRVAPGISARGSHRSVRKPLGLYGSCHSVHQTLGTEGTQIQCANIRGNRSTIPRQHRSAFPFARSRLYFLRIQRIR